MKKFLLIVLIMSAAVAVHAQSPNGKAMMVKFTNASASFTVPEGKTWYINQAFVTYKVDEDTRYFIIVKSMNGVALAELSTTSLKSSGVYLFNSNKISENSKLILPENTTFELLIYSGTYYNNNLTYATYDGQGYLNYVEVDN